MDSKLRWEAFTKEDRKVILEEIKEVVSRNGGGIVDFHMFSDLAMHLSIEIPSHCIPDLYQDLKEVVRVSDVELKEVDTFTTMEQTVSLNLSFVQGEGELKTDVPSVPG